MQFAVFAPQRDRKIRVAALVHEQGARSIRFEVLTAMHDPAPGDDALSDAEPFARLFAVSELSPGSAKMVTVGEFDIAIFNVAGEFFAIDDVCPHIGGALSEGHVRGDVVACPLHGWCFSLRDGKMPVSARRSVATFDVRVEDGEVYVSRTPRTAESRA